jgi:hypothetical protein
MNIPVPYNGYWRKLEIKKDVFKPPLPSLKPGESETYEFRIEKKEENILLDKYQKLINQEENPANKIIVKNKYLRDHPLVSKTRQLLALEKKDRDGMLRIVMTDALNIAVTPQNLSRALRIMNALIYGLEERKFVVKTSLGYHRLPKTILYFDEQEIEIDIREVMKITTVKKENNNVFNKTPEYERQLIPTGILRLEIKNFWDNGTTRIVKDTKSLKLEEQLNFFIIFIYRVINYDIKRNALWEEERKQEEEREQKRNKIIEEKKKENTRTEKLFKMADEWIKTEMTRKFLDEIKRRLLWKICLLKRRRNGLNERI